MPATLKILKSIWGLGIFLLLTCLFSKSAEAAVGGPQNCTVGQTCTIGEFVFDDSYTPIATASCTLTSKDPSGTTYTNEQAMTSSSDGWYQYSFSAPSTTGYYRAQMCCLVDGAKMCIDKSFEVKSLASTGSAPSADEVASAVWSYSSKSLTNFGTLASDVWSVSSRSLTGFNNLIADIWGHSDRKLTTADLGVNGKLATQQDVQNAGANSTDIATIKKNTSETRLLVEQLVNKPIVQNFLEEETPNLTEKLGQTKMMADQMYVSNHYLASKLGVLVLKWNSLSSDEILDSVSEIAADFGEESDSATTAMFGQVDWFKKNWNWKQIEEVEVQAKAAKSAISTVMSMLSVEGKSRAVLAELKSAVDYFDSMTAVIGDSTDQMSAKTIFAKIKEIGGLAEVLDIQGNEVDQYLSDWQQSKVASSKLNDVTKKVMAVNRVPRAGVVLAATFADVPVEKQLKNKLLGLRALINANKILLARGVENSMANTWLEEGSVVFKTLITNPSKLVSQKVPLKYYLPAEIKKEDIINTDKEVTVEYDTEKNQLYVTGEFSLKPGESKTVSVRVEDIWVVSEDEINTLRRQAADLAKPLEKTAYFAQGVTLKSDIDVSLDKVLGLQKSAVTPEQKIRAYREAQIEMNAAKTMLESLKGLVTQSSSTSSMLGFVGGTQAIGVWGLMIVIGAGFVALMIFIASMMKKNNDEIVVKKSKDEKEDSKHNKKHHGGGTGWVQVRFVAITLAVAGASAGGGALIMKQSLVSSGRQVANPVVVAQNRPTETPVMVIPTQEVLGESVENKIISIQVVVPKGDVINVRDSADKKSKILYQLKKDTTVEKVGEEGEWIEVKFMVDEVQIDGWIHQDFIANQPH